MKSFNTVNGKRCCNSILVMLMRLQVKSRFNTVNGKRCCNSIPQKASIHGA